MPLKPDEDVVLLVDEDDFVLFSDEDTDEELFADMRELEDISDADTSLTNESDELYSDTTETISCAWDQVDFSDMPELKSISDDDLVKLADSDLDIDYNFLRISEALFAKPQEEFIS